MKAESQNEVVLPKVETCPSCRSKVFEEDIRCFCDCCVRNSKDRA